MNISPPIGKWKWKDTGYSLALILAGAALLFTLFFIKSRTMPLFHEHPILSSYTIFMTVFQLSRLAAAVFYKRAFVSMTRRYASCEYEPIVTFVIPCKNEEVAIRNTISKCFEVDYPSEKVEVIVINDGSTDGTLQVLNELKGAYASLIIVDWKENRGKRQGMVEGFRRAQGEIIVQLDSDSYVNPQSLRALLEPFKNPDVGAVCAHSDPENANQNILTRMQAAYYFMSFRIMKAAESLFSTVFCCSGCSSAYRRDAVLPIMEHWLNERFLGRLVTFGDDRALTNWVLKRGYKTVYTDRARAYTIVPHTLRQLLKQQLRWKKSWIINAYFTLRYIFKKDFFIGAFYFLPLTLISFLTPAVAFVGLVVKPFLQLNLPIFYIMGALLVTSIFLVYYRLVARENRYWFYLYLWQLMSIVLFSGLMLVAILRIRDRRWGTR